jgi:putative endonuclease
MFSTYILWSDLLKKFYAGSTQDLDQRLLRHNTGKVNFTSKGIPWQLIWSKPGVDRKEVYNLEMKIKSRGIRRFLEDNGGESNIFQ